jgi:DNA-binding HxlR family transcriptional regulator
MLTLRLRSLERDGMIARTTLAGQPPGVEYSLTPLGAGFVAQLDAIMQWIRGHQAQIRAARERFEREQATAKPVGEPPGDPR